MELTTLDRARIRALLESLCDSVDADWVLVGGALVTLWLEDARRTDDIDLVGLEGTNDERFALYDFLEEAGLPYEIVNTAADFVLTRIEGWRDGLVTLVEGSRGAVYRPTPTVFLLSKIGRLSQRDLDDVLLVLEREPVDAERVVEAVARLTEPTSAGVAERRSRLAAALRARR